MGRRAAEQRDELAAFQMIELHFGPLPARAGSQDIELARISQEVTEQLYNLLAVDEGARIGFGGHTRLIACPGLTGRR
jgi:hypothetical protein